MTGWLQVPLDIFLSHWRSLLFGWSPPHLLPPWLCSPTILNGFRFQKDEQDEEGRKKAEGREYTKEGRKKAEGRDYTKEGGRKKEE